MLPSPLRSLIFVTTFAALTAGCGAPEVDVPTGNDQPTSQAPSSELPAPTVQPPPARYPYAKLAIRGSSTGATRVLVEGGGNPAAASVQPVDGTFCVIVDLAAAPAHYALTVRTQAGDGRLSEPTTVELDRANDAPPPADATLCGGVPAS